MNAPTNISAREQSAFDRALAEYLRARNSLNAMPVETTSQEDELIAMDAMGAAEERLFKADAKSIEDVRALAEIAWQEPASTPSDDMVAAVLVALRKLAPGQSRTFDAKTWLKCFIEHGGGWTNRDGKVALVSPVPAGETLQGLLWELRTRGEEDQVKALIISRGEPLSSDALNVSAQEEWKRLRRDYGIAKAALNAHTEPKGYAFGSAENDAHEAETERLANAQADAFDALMLHPAPDLTALAHKLAVHSGFLQGDNWHKGAEIAEQLAADAARLLAGEA